MGNFDAHKWFKKSYLQEGMSDEEYAKAKEAERKASAQKKKREGKKGKQFVKNPK